MKLIIASLSLILSFSAMATAAVIQSGKYNAQSKKIELDVSYGGGCSKHFFKLEFAGGCMESFPVQCPLNLVHTTDKPDFCEAYIGEKLKLDLPSGIFGDSYFKNAHFTIKGAAGSSFSFQLP